MIVFPLFSICGFYNLLRTISCHQTPQKTWLLYQQLVTISIHCENNFSNHSTTSFHRDWQITINWYRCKISYLLDWCLFRAKKKKKRMQLLLLQVEKFILCKNFVDQNPESWAWTMSMNVFGNFCFFWKGSQLLSLKKIRSDSFVAIGVQLGKLGDIKRCRQKLLYASSNILKIHWLFESNYRCRKKCRRNFSYASLLFSQTCCMYFDLCNAENQSPEKACI